MTTPEGAAPPGAEELAVMALPGDDGYVRLRIFRVVGNQLGECIQSVALYPESARSIAMRLTMASIECEEGLK